jgi:glycosyltransferase involved in cell wall biosynthesis
LSLPIFINGRFLSQPLTGVQRYANEIVRSLDELLSEDEAPRGRATVTLLAPPNALQTPKLKIIAVQKVGAFGGHLWDQTFLPFAARSGYLLSLANTGPVWSRRHLVVLHDAQVYRFPGNFSTAYSWLHRALGLAYARTARVATVSQFSRNELSAVLGIDVNDIPIVPNSADHFTSIVPDRSIVEGLGLRERKYFLALGSPSRNKNIALAVEAAARLQDRGYPLVVVGDANDQVFRGGAAIGGDYTIWTGRLSDEQIAALYENALAFVFPSRYEGFGIPPLEAMIFGCPVIASNAEAVRETCANAAVYFDADDVDRLGALMRERIALGPATAEEIARQKARLFTYSWRRSAEAVVRAIVEMERLPGGSSRAFGVKGA